jgi:hypothetical protein
MQSPSENPPATIVILRFGITNAYLSNTLRNVSIDLDKSPKV